MMKKDYLTELREKLLGDPEIQGLISMRAYEIYLGRGSEPGRESDDWFQAEREILAILVDEEIRRGSPANVEDVIVEDVIVQEVVAEFSPLMLDATSVESTKATSPKKARASKKAEAASVPAAAEAPQLDPKPDSKPARKTGATAKVVQKKAAAKGANLQAKGANRDAKKVTPETKNKKANTVSKVSAASSEPLDQPSAKKSGSVRRKSKAADHA